VRTVWKTERYRRNCASWLGPDSSRLRPWPRWASGTTRAALRQAQDRLLPGRPGPHRGPRPEGTRKPGQRGPSWVRGGRNAWRGQREVDRCSPHFPSLGPLRQTVLSRAPVESSTGWRPWPRLRADIAIGSTACSLLTAPLLTTGRRAPYDGTPVPERSLTRLSKPPPPGLLLPSRRTFSSRRTHSPGRARIRV
jgi:hypothetical protein